MKKYIWSTIEWSFPTHALYSLKKIDLQNFLN